MDIVIPVLMTIIAAGVPLLLPALGEHVSERAGVLNLGVEGMMIMGAAVGFAAAITFGSPVAGVAAGILAGMAMAAIFALFAVWLTTNQVATGLALTIFGLGLANLLGAPFVGQKLDPIRQLEIPVLGELPVIGRLIFGHDPLVYGSAGLAVFVAWYLARSRGGLVLRGIGENQASAHALGHDVRWGRTMAVLFGGACAGLGGAYLSLVATPFWSPGMTSGRGWIALALVVFAAGRVWRLLLGALLFGATTVLQLHAQAGGIGVPSQLLSAAPYLATILALVLLSSRSRRGGDVAGSLGRPFIPDR